MWMSLGSLARPSACRRHPWALLKGYDVPASLRPRAPPSTERNLARLVALSRDCERVSSAACRMVHPLELQFSLVTVGGVSLGLCDAKVPTFEQGTSADPQFLVGVPILHSLPMSSALEPRVSKLRKVYPRIKDPDVTPAIQLKAFRAYAIGSLDYLMQGVPICPEDLKAA